MPVALRKRLRQQPGGPFTVNWDNPLTVGLHSLYIPVTGRLLANAAGPGRGVLHASAGGIVPTSRGLGARVLPNGSFNSYGVDFAGSIPLNSFYAGMSLAVITANGYTLSGNPQGRLLQVGTNAGLDFNAADSHKLITFIASGVRYTATQSGNQTGDNVVSYSCHADAVAGDYVHYSYVNGRDGGRLTGSPVGLNNSPLTSLGGVSGQGYCLTDYLLVAAWNRALSAEEHLRFYADPWQLAAPYTRRVFVPVSGGGATYQSLYPTSTLAKSPDYWGGDHTAVDESPEAPDDNWIRNFQPTATLLVRQGATTGVLNMDAGGIVLNKPSTVVEGDILFFFVAVAAGAPNFQSVSSSVTLDNYRGIYGGTDARLWIGWRTATASEPATYTLTPDTSPTAANVAAACIVVRNAALPIDGLEVLGYAQTALTDSHTVPSRDAAAGDLWLLAWAFDAASNLVDNLTFPADTTNITSVRSTTDLGDAAVYARYKPITVDGATGSKTATTNNSYQVASAMGSILLHPKPMEPLEIYYGSGSASHTLLTTFPFSFTDATVINYWVEGGVYPYVWSNTLDWVRKSGDSRISILGTSQFSFSTEPDLLSLDFGFDATGTPVTEPGVFSAVFDVTVYDSAGNSVVLSDLTVTFTFEQDGA